jgi:hypothetical protein
MLAFVPRMRISIDLTGISSVQKYRAAQISKSNQRTAPEPVWLTGDVLLGPAMACSLRVSLQGFRGKLPHLTQRTSFPLPSTGQAIRPPGGSTANFCNLPRVSEATLVCKHCVWPKPFTLLQLFESNRNHSRLQAVILAEAVSPRCDFPRVTGTTPDCKRRIRLKPCSSPCNFSTITTSQTDCKVQCLWKAFILCGKRGLLPWNQV